MRWPLLLLIAAIAPARAQPADCAAIPVGPDIRVEAWPGGPRDSRGIARLDLGDTPIFGTRCRDETPPPADILRGPSAPNGLLQGTGPPDVLRTGPRDVLHNTWRGEVTVQPPQ